MNKFQIGDTVFLKRLRCEAEIIDVHPKHKHLVLCQWLNSFDAIEEVYFNIADIEMVKPASKKDPKSGKKNAADPAIT